MPRIKKKTSIKKTTRGPAKRSSLSVPVYSLAGRASGTLTLPKEIFGQKVNKKLLSQALRVYITNQKSLNASTKTRGEVEGSTAKIYRQKGTGRARHGAIRAPIFVGGGIVFGPKPRKVRLELPQRMKKAALVSAFSAKMSDKQVIGLSGLEKASGKTKEMSGLMSSVVSRQSSDKKQKQTSALIITGEKQDNVVRAVRNIPGVDISPVNLINAYEVVKHSLLLVTKEAVEKLSKPAIKEQK
ncbi:50S ribosomal protein L4 [Candidatus Daviesbacteria bacterium]|nr:50S ribosomal protein L4 [Candidatus Daviesbacteria bacterium]